MRTLSTLRRMSIFPGQEEYNNQVPNNSLLNHSLIRLRVACAGREFYIVLT